jgi:RNA polymerase sigma-70 factor (ECF subfamily)
MKPEDIAAALLQERTGLIAFAVTIVRDFHVAEDLFQEVCIRAIASADTFADELHLLKWSRLTTRHRAIDTLRKSREKVGLSIDLLEVLEAEWPCSASNNFPTVEALQECIGRLTNNNQEILRLRYFETLSGIDVAKHLGRKVETVYQALARIHRQLAVCVAQTLANE